jgi:hypothetical protein
VKRAYLILAITASLARADSLDAVLLRMDQAAQKFMSMSASVHKTQYTDVLTETSEEDGTFKMMKHAKTGVILLAEFTGRDQRKLKIAGSKLEIYYPKANTEDIYDTRKYAKSVDQFLLVGFGQSRAELEKTYNIKLGGSETVGNIKTTRIDLTPKKAETQKLFNVIELWIPDGKANPIQEKMISGKESKDYILFQFSNVEIRGTSDKALPDSDFELNLPAGVKHINAGK